METQKNIIKVYKTTCTSAYMACEQGEGYSLSPWGDNTDYYQGYDDGGQDYILPDGYKLAETKSAELMIFDQAGNSAQIAMNDAGCPELMTFSGNILLQQAK